MILTKLTLLALALLAGAVLSASRQEQSDEHAPEQPVAQNARLAKLAGDYTWTSTFDVGDGSPPMSSTGTAKFTSILGSRFLQQEESGGMAGMPYDALKLYGFNASAGRYEGLWLYTGSTAMMNLTGSSKDGGKTVTFDASYAADPSGALMEFEITLAEIDVNQFTIQLAFKAPEGAPTSTLKVTYTRKH